MSFNVTWSFKEVLNAINPNNPATSAQQLSQFIGVPSRPLSLRRLIHRSLAWRVQHQHLIQHVFVLMLENRSFDHIFGYTEFHGGTDTTTDEQIEVDGLLDQAGQNFNPLTNQTVNTTATADFEVSVDPKHEFDDVVMQLCGPNAVTTDGRGRPISDYKLPGGIYPPIDNSGFVANFVAHVPNPDLADTPMKCYHHDKLPVLNGLAKNFVICDRWFGSHPGPTLPNRFFVHSASTASYGEADSPSWTRILFSALGVASGKFHFNNGTIYDRLAAKGLKYQIYAGNNCPSIRAMRNNTDDLDLNFVRLTDLEQDLQNEEFPFSYVFIEPDYGKEGGVLGLLEKAFGHCDSNVANDMHPGPGSDARLGEALIKRVYDAIRGSPIWNKSVLVILFDEHGGFFDHVPPPAAYEPNDGVVNNTHKYKFNQLGARVPALIVSPWVRYNAVDHTIYDHTSVLRSIEKLFDLSNMTDRDGAAMDFLEVFSQLRPRPDALPEAPPPQV